MDELLPECIESVEEDVETLRQDVEAPHARAETLEQRVEALQALLGAAYMDIIDLRESRRADRLEMVELQSQA
ncbi:hypothetical protein Tco_0730361 [Tanacetum coccineum]|uniref:Uncharacterized protein n=1 Tax=Tanacetum coccineum TaxID=301880 RepID=A0ABQ4YSH5_9ASTR